MHESPLVSIGLPVFNRPELLRKALKSLVQQSYSNIEIIISDDCSPDRGTRDVVLEFKKIDTRIRSYRQKKNIGQFGNHIFVLKKARGLYFFWASEDDLWHPEFVEAGIQALEKETQYQVWICTMNNIDSFGREIRTYPGFSRFSTTHNKKRDLVRYLLEPEIMGKSNIFHGIYLYQALKDTVKAYGFRDFWGSDHCFNLAFLTRFGIIGTDQVMHYKRVSRECDTEQHPFPIVIDNPNLFTFPLRESPRYIYEHMRAAHGTPYTFLVLRTMLRRMPDVMRNTFLTSARFTRSFIWYWLPLNIFRRKGLSSRYEKKTVDLGWATVRTIGTIQISINDVYAPIMTAQGKVLLPIKETPHYQWIQSLVARNEDIRHRNEYRAYLEKYYQKHYADVNSGLRHVEKLVDAFRDKKTLFSIIAFHPRPLAGNPQAAVIFDGVHRAAIAKALGHEQLKCQLYAR